MDPMLGPLTNNGGPTDTQALLPGSPAIDAGSSDCPPPPTDQRGVSRPQDGDGNGSAICDIGAFELEAAPTPGKVTGGGQIVGDPVFSALGDLLSSPALIPSLADPTAQASFGFVAQCCPATGNLEYDDHPADVRIKAISFTALFISSPGTACPATPGSKHAEFTGMAAVIRSTGTTTEPFTVRVDDCSEPGTADQFGIETTSYSNGPVGIEETLIGGNIQIH